MRTITLTLIATLMFTVGPPVAAQPSPPITPTVACRPILTASGAMFMIALPADHTTGFSWVLEEPLKRASIAYRGKRYVPAGTATPGAMGSEVWTFAAIRPGKMLLSLKYIRPSDNPPAAGEESFFVVIVRDYSVSAR